MPIKTTVKCYFIPARLTKNEILQDQQVCRATNVHPLLEGVKTGLTLWKQFRNDLIKLNIHKSYNSATLLPAVYSREAPTQVYLNIGGRGQALKGPR